MSTSFWIIYHVWKPTNSNSLQCCNGKGGRGENKTNRERILIQSRTPINGVKEAQTCFKIPQDMSSWKDVFKGQTTPVGTTQVPSREATWRPGCLWLWAMGESAGSQLSELITPQSFSPAPPATQEKNLLWSLEKLAAQVKTEYKSHQLEASLKPVITFNSSIVFDIKSDASQNTDQFLWRPPRFPEKGPSQPDHQL